MTVDSAAVPTRDPALRGAAYGVTVLAFFALAWLGWGTGGHLPTAAEVSLMLAAVAVSAALAATAWRRWYTTSVPGAAGDSPGSRAMGRRFRLIVAVEWIGLGVAAYILGATRHANAIPAVICAGVGLHFIPLARLFGVRVYHLTAAAMCGLAVATFALAPFVHPLWTVLPGVGSAIALYATGVAVLSWWPRSR
jgi:hypothetical protein